MNQIEQIEYYLGKDSLPNLHWKPGIPSAYSVPARKNDLYLGTEQVANQAVTLGGIEYKHNNLSYRSNFDYSTDLDNIVLILGDSDAVGIGVEFCDIYSTKLQQLVDYTVVNLGVPGLSADGMARIGSTAMLALGSKVKHVCVLWPTSSLREFVSKKFTAGIHSMSTELPYENWWDHIDWVSNNYNYQKNKLLIESVTKNISAEYHDLIVNRHDPKSVVSYIKTGPFTEFDSTSHNAIANYFHKKIMHQPSWYQRSRSLT